MALKLSKKKFPKREEKQVKESKKIEGVVFDRETIITISRLMATRVIKSLDYPVYEGKEAVVFRATSGDKLKIKPYVAVKIYKIETGNFQKMQKYIIGDKRFEGIKLTNKFKVLCTWAKKEFKNLILAKKAGVSVPEVVKVKDNLLIMEFLGEEHPAPRLKDVDLTQPDVVCASIIEDMSKLKSINLVHSDLSEYNILFWRNKHYFIDMGQAVLTTHPNAEEFYERDLRNIKHYFEKKYKIKD